MIFTGMKFAGTSYRICSLHWFVQPLDGLWTPRGYHERVENERPEHAFLVRTWRETGDARSRAEWRGFVEHLPTKQRRYFGNLADLCAFILTHQLAENQ